MANASIRYGASIRKRYRKIKKEKTSRYTCEMCGKNSVKKDKHRHMEMQALQCDLCGWSIFHDNPNRDECKKDHRKPKEVNKW